MVDVMRKLQVKPGMTMCVLDAPGSPEGVLGPLPEGASLTGSPPADATVLFVRDRADLDRRASPLVEAARADRLAWICYPKGGARAGTDLNRDVLRELMQARGAEAVTQVAVDDTWSALRFRPRPASRSRDC
jgi:hypothetical protein